MALSRVLSEIFNVEKCDLEIRVKGHRNRHVLICQPRLPINVP